METIKISLSIKSGAFRVFFNKIRGQKEKFNSSEISKLKKLFSNERARILYAIKNDNPTSIYQLTKLLERDFGSVLKDIRLLEKFGFIYLDSINKGRRKTLKPVLATDKIIITINL